MFVNKNSHIFCLRTCLSELSTVAPRVGRFSLDCPLRATCIDLLLMEDTTGNNASVIYALVKSNQQLLYYSDNPLSQMIATVILFRSQQQPQTKQILEDPSLIYRKICEACGWQHVQLHNNGPSMIEFLMPQISKLALPTPLQVCVPQEVFELAKAFELALFHCTTEWIYSHFFTERLWSLVQGSTRTMHFVLYLTGIIGKMIMKRKQEEQSEFALREIKKKLITFFNPQLAKRLLLG